MPGLNDERLVCLKAWESNDAKERDIIVAALNLLIDAELNLEDFRLGCWVAIHILHYFVNQYTSDFQFLKLARQDQLCFCYVAITARDSASCLFSVKILGRFNKVIGHTLESATHVKVNNAVIIHLHLP